MSYLTQVQECNGSGQCFEPMRFDWGGSTDEDGIDPNDINSFNTGSGYRLNAPNNNGVKYLYQPADFNGDGKTDMIHFWAKNKYNIWNSNGNGTFSITGGTLPANIDPDRWLVQVGEFNGDNKADFFHLKESTNGKRIRVYTSNGNNTFSSYEFQPPSNYDASLENDGFRTGDFNGDGLTDIMNIKGNTVHTWFKNRDSNGFTIKTYYVKISGDNLEEDNHRIVVGDFNGDGMDDLWHPTSQGKSYMLRSNGNGTFVTTSYLPWGGYSLKNPNDNDVEYMFMPGDYNGDGMTDLVHIVSREYMHVWVSKGNGQFHVTKVNRPNSSYSLRNPASKYLWRSGDFNGDGLTDLFHVTSDNSMVYWYGSVNAAGDVAFNLQYKNYSGYGCSGLYTGRDMHFNLLDLQGNGRTDMVHFSGSCVKVWKTDSDGSHKIIGFQNGTSVNRIDVTYKYISENDVYDNNAIVSYPRVRSSGGMCVVSDTYEPNGLANNSKNRISYKYEGGFINVHGRGFRGFNKVTVTDHVNGYNLITTYERDAKCMFARIKQTEKRLISENRLLEKVVNYPFFRQSVSGKPVYWSEFSRVDKQTYELNSSRSSYSRTDYTYDSYANVTRSHERLYGRNSEIISEAIKTFRYYNNSNSWRIRKLRTDQIQKKYRGQNGNTLRKNYYWDSSYKNVVRKELVSSSQNERLNTYYTYDVRGNKTQERHYGWDGYGNVNRHQYWTYSSATKYRWPSQVRNNINHTTSYLYDLKYGMVRKTIDPNGIWTLSTFDGFGREVSVQKKGEKPIHKFRMYDLNNAKSFFRLDVNGRANKTSTTSINHDLLGRTTRAASLLIENGQEKWTHVYTDYNPDGTVQRKSNPRFHSDSWHWTTYTYDALNRVIRLTAPSHDGQSRVTQTTYNTFNRGVVSVVTNPLGQQITTYTYPDGTVESVKDNKNKWLYFYYNGDGLEKQVRFPNSKRIYTYYDRLGRVVRTVDPDIGDVRSSYNSFNETISESHIGIGQTQRHKYDGIGRKIETTYQNGQKSSWQYDQNPYSKGYITRIYNSNSRFEEKFYYDNLARRNRVYSRDITRSKTFNAYFYYDSYGRLSGEKDAGGLRVYYTYDDVGELLRVRESVYDVQWDDYYYNTIWTRGPRNAAGNSISNTYGNGVVEYKTYSDGSEKLKSIQVKNGGLVLERHGFTFNKIGLMTRRTYSGSGTSYRREDFSYDGLNRLVRSQVAGRSAVVVSYNDVGNITYKSDIGCYKYQSNRPHAVTKIQRSETDPTAVRTFGYDGSGRVTNYNNTFTFLYNVFNKPSRIQQNGSSNRTEFAHDANGRRFYQRSIKNGKTVEKWYIGDNYEEEKIQGETLKTHYITAGDELIAIRKNSSQGGSIKYAHSDHLGSISMFTNANRTVAERMAFDPWGRKRNANTWAPQETFSTVTDRGFTAHEHLDLGEFIHMNARVYDPVIGRVLAPDRFIQTEKDLQGFNRYSYVLNNPLVLTDPSGNFAVGAFLINAAASWIVSTVTSNILSSLGVSGIANSLLTAAASFGTSYAVSASNPLSTGGSLGGASAASWNWGDFAFEMFQASAPYISKDLAKVGNYAGYAKMAVGIADGFTKAQQAGAAQATETEWAASIEDEFTSLSISDAFNLRDFYARGEFTIASAAHAAWLANKGADAAVDALQTNIKGFWGYSDSEKLTFTQHLKFAPQTLTDLGKLGMGGGTTLRYTMKGQRLTANITGPSPGSRLPGWVGINRRTAKFTIPNASNIKAREALGLMVADQIRAFRHAGTYMPVQAWTWVTQQAGYKGAVNQYIGHRAHFLRQHGAKISR